MDFVLWDTTGTIAQSDREFMCATIGLQLNRDVARYWPGASRLRAGSSADDVMPGEVPAVILPQIDVQGAEAYHSETRAGPAIVIDASAFTSTMRDGQALSVGFGHECLEACGDADCNLWVDDGRGFEWARELVDAVQGNWYLIGGCAVPDFVLPSFFDPMGRPPFSFMDTAVFASLVADGLVQAGGHAPPPAPFACAPGGYQVRRNVGTGDIDVFGDRASRAIERTRRGLGRLLRRWHVVWRACGCPRCGP